MFRIQGVLRMSRILARYDVHCYQCGSFIGRITVTDESDPVWLKRDIKILCDTCFIAWKGVPPRQGAT
jgi:hypothetical protein